MWPGAWARHVLALLAIELEAVEALTHSVVALQLQFRVGPLVSTSERQRNEATPSPGGC